MRNGLLLLIAGLLLATASLAQSVDESSEQEIVRLLNRERSERGLATLVVDSRLQEEARKHSKLMAKRDELSHVLPGEQAVAVRLGGTGMRFDVSGENVGFAADAEKAHRALMNSPGHRANILGAEYNSVGVGVVRKGDAIYVTQDFARRYADARPSDAETAIASAFNRARREAGAPILSRVPSERLKEIACDMAKHDRLNAGAAREIPKVNNVVVFTAVDFNQLPESLLRLRNAQASAFSVAACYESSKSYQNSVYWVAVVTYF